MSVRLVKGVPGAAGCFFGGAGGALGATGGAETALRTAATEGCCATTKALSGWAQALHRGVGQHAIKVGLSLEHSGYSCCLFFRGAQRFLPSGNGLQSR